MNGRDLAVALLCFSGKKAAATHEDPLQERLRSAGDNVLQTTILQVDGKRKASVHDPRRVIAGTLTAALTWGLFGLVAGTNKVESTIIWAVIGAICGGIFAYTTEHVLTKSELARIGRKLAPDSSALVIFAETREPRRILSTAGDYTPTAASVAVVDSDLASQVFAGTTASSEVSDVSAGPTAELDQTSALSMLLYRYPDPKAAAQVAHAVTKAEPKADGAPQVELVVEVEPDGGRRVVDPTHGTAAWARSDVISWGAFGVVVGAIAGAVGGGGLHGLVTGAVVTGVGWAVFGLAAGALYGLWAGRAISARRLKGIGSILAPGTSSLLAWADGAPPESSLATYDRPGSQRLVLCFNPVDGGAVLETVPSPSVPRSAPAPTRPSESAHRIGGDRR